MANKKQKSTFLRLVGQRVASYRHARGNLTQEALADAVNSNATYISKIENGNAEGLTLLKLVEIARALSVSVADLVNVEIEDDKQTARLQNVFQGLQARDRDVVLGVLKRLVRDLERSAP